MFETSWFRPLAALATLSLLVTTVHAVTIETVPVGNPGNAGELSGAGAPDGYGPDRVCGAVKYVYEIGKYAVTAGQYTEFLNAVAADDLYGLYDPSMWTDGQGCKIRRTGEPGSYEYLVDADGDGNEDPNWVDRPVNYVSWGDAARFANWLHNGQPTGAQDPNTTEDGAYFLDGATRDAELVAIRREPDWKWAIPSEDEWYKAAYYKGGGTGAGYWDFPTQSNTAPTPELPGGTDMTNGSANYYSDGYLDTTYYRTEVGAYTAKPSDSAYGTFDQGGNVVEWNEATPYDDYRGLRGGSFWHWGGATDDRLRASYRRYTSAGFQHQGIGFRVARIPEPSTAVLGIIGVLCVLWWRRAAG